MCCEFGGSPPLPGHYGCVVICRRGTIMKYRIRTNGVSNEPTGIFGPSAAVGLTRYVRRVRELRQDVSGFNVRFFLTLCRS